MLNGSVLISNRKVRIKFQKSGRLSGVHLHDEEVFLLQQLVIHQSMQSISIHEIYRELSNRMGRVRSTNAISNRLAVLINSGILVHRKERVGAGSVYYYHYRLGKRGIESLLKLDLLNDSDAERIYGYTSRLQIPSNHTKASSLLANRIYLSFLDKDWFSELEHQRGIAYPTFSNNDGIVPDWVFSRGDVILCLETDTGTERQSVISPKFDGYIRKANDLMSDGKELVVVFSIVDSSLAGDSPSNRDKRIASIKDFLPPLTEWPSNLHFYVVSAERTPPLVERILTYAEPSNSFERFAYAEDWVRQATDVLGSYYDVEILDTEQLFLPNRNREMDCDLVVSVRENGRKPNLYAVTYGEEGSVVTYQLARANAKRVATINEQQQNTTMKQLICYDNTERMEKDVFGYLFESDVSLTNSLSWGEAIKNERPPDVMRIITPYTKDWRLFNE